MTDMQGRLQGKRCGADPLPRGCPRSRCRGVQLPARGRRRHEHRRRVRAHLLARGYGDFVLRPDLDTLRIVPWHDATALVLCDVLHDDGTPVAPSPRQVLRAQLARLAERGFEADVGTELEFVVFRDTYEAASEARVPRAHPRQPLQRRLLAARHRARRAAAPADPQRDAGRGDDGRIGQGRVQPRPARDHLPVFRRADHVRQPQHLQDRRQGDRAPGRLQPHVHGQVRRARGELVPRPHQPPHLGVRRARRWPGPVPTDSRR